jgi:hypothetical protein
MSTSNNLKIINDVTKETYKLDRKEIDKTIGNVGYCDTDYEQLIDFIYNISKTLIKINDDGKS